MKIKVHKDDWVRNAGIVGFFNVMDKETVLIQDSYIEFDSSILEDFVDRYFDYFLNQYDIYEVTKKRCEKLLATIKKKGIKKDTLASIKNTVSYQNTKIDKFNKEASNKIKENLKLVLSSKTYEDIELYTRLSLNIIKQDDINKRLTCNLFKSILQSNFFGQVSYLNVGKAKLGIEELKDIMYRDYVETILMYSKLMDSFTLAKESGNIDLLSNELNKLIGSVAKTDTNKGLLTIFKNINKKYIDKGKSLDDIQLYLNELEICETCEKHPSLDTVISESTFAVLGVSNKNAQNFFWDFNYKKKTCPICKLISACIPLGVTRSNGLYSFVNTESNLIDLIESNIGLQKMYTVDNILGEFINDTISRNKKMSKWQLSNTLFIEFITDIDNKKTILNYANIPYHLAEFFSNNSNTLLDIQNSSLRNEVINNILYRKNSNSFIERKLKDKLLAKNQFASSSDYFSAVKVFSILNKNGESYMKKLDVMNMVGKKIRDYYISTNSENKITTLSYRLLNSAKAGSRKDLGDTLLRVMTIAKIPVPQVYTEAFITSIDKTSDEDMTALVHAFVCGLTTVKYTKEDKGE